jgi:ATP-binding cassette, subfamily F, member 3
MVINLQALLELSSALDAQTDPTRPVRAVREVKHERLLSKLDQAKLTAQRRSGARGLKARKDLNATEDEVKESQAGLDQDLGGIEAAVLSKETQEAAEMLADIQAALEMVGTSFSKDSFLH